jgi:hypothetical protein
VEAPVRAFIPDAFSHFAVDPIEEKYEANLERIKEAQRKQANPAEGTAPTIAGRLLAAKIGDDGSKSMVHASSSSDAKFQSTIPDYKQYIPGYKHYFADLKQAIPAAYRNVIRDYEKYIPDVEKYMDPQKYIDFVKAVENMHVESHPSRCTTVKCVDAWRKHQELAIRTFVPKAFQSFQKDAIEDEYAKNVKRIKASDNASNETGVAAISFAADWEQYVPQYAKYQDVSKWVKFGKSMQLRAKSQCKKAYTCETKEELDAWKTTREAPIKKYVPKEYQHWSLNTIEAKYKENLERMKQSQKEVEKQNAKKAADEKSSNASTAAVDNLVPSYAKQVHTEMFLSYASFINQQHAPEKVSDCKNMMQLKAWYNKENAIIKEFVPQAYQTFPARALEKKYEEYRRRIEASQEAQQKTETSPLQLASLAHYVSSPLVALAAIMFSAAALVSWSRHFRRESSLEEALLESEAPCAA